MASSSNVIDIYCLPDIGTLSLTLSAFRILYKDKATTWGHQNISFVSQLHVTDVILHLYTNRERKNIHQIKSNKETLLNSQSKLLRNRKKITLSTIPVYTTRMSKRSIRGFLSTRIEVFDRVR